MQIGRRDAKFFIKLSYHRIQTSGISVDGHVLGDDSPICDSPSPWTASSPSPPSSFSGSDDCNSLEWPTVVADLSSGLEGSHTLAPSAYVNSSQHDVNSLPASGSETRESSLGCPTQLDDHEWTPAMLPLANSPASSVVVDLTGQIETLSPHAFAHGGFSDIHMGQWARRTDAGQIETVRHLDQKPFRSQTARRFRLLSNCCASLQDTTSMVAVLKRYITLFCRGTVYNFKP